MSFTGGDIYTALGQLTYRITTLENQIPNAAGFEKTTNKNVANGYAGLGVNALVPPAGLGTGNPSSATFLRGDGTWAAPTAAAGTGVANASNMPPFATTGNLTPVANTLYVAQVAILNAATLTGILFGSTTAAGNALTSLFNASGGLLAQSASTATTASAQAIPFTGTYNATPGLYFIGIQFSSTTTRGGAIAFCPNSAIAQGTFTVPASITPPTTASLTVTPLVATY